MIGSVGGARLGLNRGLIIRAIVGIAISFVTVLVIVRGVDLAQVADILRHDARIGEPSVCSMVGFC